MTYKTIFGSLLFVAGIVIGLYAGVWWGLIGGLFTAVTALTSDTPSTTQFGYGVLRFLFATPIGVLAGICFAIPGALLMLDSSSFSMMLDSSRIKRRIKRYF